MTEIQASRLKPGCPMFVYDPALFKMTEARVWAVKDLVVEFTICGMVHRARCHEVAVYWSLSKAAAIRSALKECRDQTKVAASALASAKKIQYACECALDVAIAEAKIDKESTQ